MSIVRRCEGIGKRGSPVFVRVGSVACPPQERGFKALKWERGKSSFCLTEKWTQRVSLVTSQDQVIDCVKCKRDLSTCDKSEHGGNF
jgi:hypothetical protein